MRTKISDPTSLADPSLPYLPRHAYLARVGVLNELLPYWTTTIPEVFLLLQLRSLEKWIRIEVLAPQAVSVNLYTAILYSSHASLTDSSSNVY